MAQEQATQKEASEKTSGGKVVGMKIPKIFKNKIFIFCMGLLLFVMAFSILFLMDKNNAIRKALGWGDIPFFTNLFRNLGIPADLEVYITTWFIFFFLFGAFFIIFFIIMVRKIWLNHVIERIGYKKGREPTKGEIARFYILFFGVLTLILAGVIAGTIVYFNLSGYINIVIQQLKSGVGQQLLYMLEALGVVLGLMLVVPVVFLLLILIFKLFIWVISILVGGVSNAVMQSEGYQKHKAISQAAADDIARKMQEAERLADGSLAAARGAANQEGTRAMAPQADILFPALTSIDKKWEDKAAEKEAEKAKAMAAIEEYNKNLAKGETPKVYEEPKVERPPFTYDQFKVLAFEFQSYLCKQKYYFDINILRAFIAGLASARLILLQGLSGTGKSTLPRVFLEYVGGDAYFFPVQATWRDRSDITGYYSDFTGEFKETELLKKLYEASYIPETLNLMVLDEMNISRVEYYFADFLSIFEYPSEDWVVPLLQVKPDTKLPKYIENGYARIPVNTWFVGTVNIDDSTFTITDKVYDRAIAIDFKELNLPFESSYNSDPHPLTAQELIGMFEECKKKPELNLSDSERQKFLKLCAFVSETFDIQFGNRIMNQIDNFLPVFVGLGGTKEQALDIMFARKILRKLDGKFESYIKDGLNKLTRFINSSYGKGKFKETELSIENYRRKLS